ncbi:hypothetical protein AV530_008240 [Patagioenas fasciata monilis]|uniref:Uncharacterized protein n=1 Tax=Patagioenas fasciata monilis TaxID=372326 RepID=A0A1V4KV87_PATFA|nr:hypothetical protein AV530_008240 [Patagioenas fasciata monilis]
MVKGWFRREKDDYGDAKPKQSSDVSWSNVNPTFLSIFRDKTQVRQPSGLPHHSDAKDQKDWVLLLSFLS